MRMVSIEQGSVCAGRRWTRPRGVCGHFEPSPCALRRRLQHGIPIGRRDRRAARRASSRASASAARARATSISSARSAASASTVTRLGQHFRKAAGHRDVNGLRALLDSSARRCPVRVKQRRVARQDAQISLAARAPAPRPPISRTTSRSGVTTSSVKASGMIVCRLCWPLAYAVAAIFSAFSRTSSIVPTM